MWQLHALIKGRVQGVGFRYTVQRYAEQMGLMGTVRNLHDGSVELYAQGSREHLEDFLLKLKEQPGMGRIDTIQTTYSNSEKEYDSFRIIH